MCQVPCYYWPSKFYGLLAFSIFCESWCTSTKPSAFWDQDFKCNYDIRHVVSTIPEMSLRTWGVCFLRVYGNETTFGSTLRQTALCIIQFARTIFSENSLELSILVKMWFFWCFVLRHAFQQLFCMTCWGTVSSILNNVVGWNRTPRCLHKICSCTQIVGKN